MAGVVDGACRGGILLNGFGGVGEKALGLVSGGDEGIAKAGIVNTCDSIGMPQERGLHLLHHLERCPHGRAHAHGSRHLRQRRAGDPVLTLRHGGSLDD